MRANFPLDWQTRKCCRSGRNRAAYYCSVAELKNADWFLMELLGKIINMQILSRLAISFRQWVSLFLGDWWWNPSLYKLVCDISGKQIHSDVGSRLLLSKTVRSFPLILGRKYYRYFENENMLHKMPTLAVNNSVTVVNEWWGRRCHNRYSKCIVKTLRIDCHYPCNYLRSYIIHSLFSFIIYYYFL